MNQSQELSIEFEAELGPISYCGKNHYQSSFKGTRLLLFISSLKDDKPIIFLYEIKTQWIHKEGTCLRKQDKSTMPEMKTYPLGPHSISSDLR